MSAQRWVRVERDPTVHHAAELLPQLMAILAEGGDACLDLQAVERIDTAGVQLLLVLRREARERHVSVQFDGVRPELRDVLAFYGLAETALEGSRE